MEDFLKKHNIKIKGNLKGLKIYVDAGHGGSDTGATYRNIIERDINLVMALELGKFLEALGAKVLYSRIGNDIEKTLSKRAQEANEWKADIFLSIHNNAGGGDGFEAIHTIFQEKSQGDEISKAIAKTIDKFSEQNIRRTFTKENDNGRDWYGVIRMTNMPAVITEGAFIDNAKDFIVINSEEKQKEFGKLIGLGICFYKGIAEEVKVKESDLVIELKTMRDSLDNIINILSKR